MKMESEEIFSLIKALEMVDNDSNNQLRAGYQSREALFKALLEARTPKDKTALHVAVAYARTKIIEQLLAVGGSELANTRAKNGGLALDDAYLELQLVMMNQHLYDEQPQLLFEKYSHRDYNALVKSLSTITENLFKYSGGKSTAACGMYYAGVDDPTSLLNLNNIPYTRDGYIEDGGRDRLLLKEHANLAVLFRDLAKESGVSELSTTDKLYLYALAFECHAERKLGAHDPDLQVLSRLTRALPTEQNKERIENALVTTIQRIQTRLYATIRYQLGRLFKRAAPTLFDTIPDNVVRSTATPQTEHQPLLGGRKPTGIIVNTSR